MWIFVLQSILLISGVMGLLLSAVVQSTNAASQLTVIQLDVLSAIAFILAFGFTIGAYKGRDSK